MKGKSELWVQHVHGTCYSWPFDRLRDRGDGLRGRIGAAAREPAR